MPRRLFSAPPSKLATYADCPRRYRFAYLTRPTPPKGPPWAHNTVGSAVHAALRSWWELPLAKRTPIAACTTEPDQYELLLAAGTGAHVVSG